MARAQDVCFDRLFDRGKGNYGWAVKHDNGYIVLSADQTRAGDLKVAFANGTALLVFPAGISRECWRLFKPSGEHRVFPPEPD